MKKSLFLLLSSVAILLANPMAHIKTTKGEIVIELRPDIAPKAVENFITHSKNGYYNGTIFHRVIKRFMIQGGDPTGTGRGGASIWAKPFEDEFAPNAVFDRPGILAMANAGPNTNGSQFFITTVPTYHLNGRHTIFGFVKDGMDTVKSIERSPTDNRDKPLIKQEILSIEIKQ